MLSPVKWDSIPDEFNEIIWRGDGESIADAPAIFNKKTRMTIFKLQLSENDRRCLIEDNPLYLIINGNVAPFAISANLGESIDLTKG